MSLDTYSDAALVVLGHGSTVNGESGAPVFQHAAELRRRNLFGEVREAFWKQEPRVNRVLAGLTATRAFIVPLFISEGYFCETIIPRELGFPDKLERDGSRVCERGRQTLVYCLPVGTHERMTSVLEARADEVVEKFPGPVAPKRRETTLFVAGHGTGRNENSRLAVERQIKALRARRQFAGVHGVFLEEEPRIGACYQIARTKFIVVVPFFISDGLHAQEDIPVLLGEARRTVRERLRCGQAAWRNPTRRKGKLVWFSSSVGTDPHIAEVILERVREAAGWLRRYSWRSASTGSILAARKAG